MGSEEMTIIPLEVYATDSNYAVIKPPGRRYPGSVIQGDSLAILCRNATQLVEHAQAHSFDDEEFLGCVQELVNNLVGRLLHYQKVLDAHGIDYPYGQAFSEDDFVQLIPDDGDQ